MSLVDAVAAFLIDRGLEAPERAHELAADLTRNVLEVMLRDVSAFVAAEVARLPSLRSPGELEALMGHTCHDVVPRVMCETCNDSHRMSLGDRTVPCTRCPLPCIECGAGAAYCRATPCACACHHKEIR